MIHQLDLEDFKKARYLFKDLESVDLSINTVFEGKFPGILYVNKKEKPTAALLFRDSRIFFLAGDADDNEFNKALKEKIEAEIFRKKNEINKDKYFLVIPTLNWVEKTKEIFSNVKKDTHNCYIFDSMKISNWLDLLPKGYSIHEIDEKFLSREDIDVYTLLLTWINWTWTTKENYLRDARYETWLNLPEAV